MLKRLRVFFLLPLASWLLLVPPLMAAEGSRGHLVSVGWLEKNLKSADLLILDASPAPVHKAQHIPGAVNIDLLTYGVHELPVAAMEARFQAWGISPEKRIVMYDQGGSMMATRLFFDLYYHGFPEQNLLLLDGGLSKWQQAGLPVSKDAGPGPAPGTFRISAFKEEARVRLPEFLNASGDPANQVLVEALGANWHFGEVAPFDRAGHIPNGILLPSADFYNPDKTFKSAEEIRRMLSYLGIRPGQPVYTYCGGGVAASVPWFALKFLADHPQVKLYKESEMGWLQDERGLPYWTYDAPFLMREARWLQAWSGRMMRTYGSGQVSVVDVRPADAFAQGHVPFALSIPAEVFRSSLSDPARLAGILGPAGVDPAHEAVVISGAGLSREAALAFVMLEHLGQRRTAICLDPRDRWEQLGVAVTKDATVVGSRKGLQDLSIPPATFPVKVHRKVVITDPKATQGLYPKVFIASGKALPTRAPDGTLVHVPYTDLLNDDGTPKPAKVIWNLLAKAGVPRYAELVCCADDPGEAAANYYILRLMGYPDIKVLVN